MPRAVLVQPPIRDFYTTPQRFSGLGMEAVRRVLVGRGWEVHVRTLPLEGRPRVVALPETLGHLTPHLLPGETGPARFFTHYRRFGPDFDEAARAILHDGPNLIVVSCFAFAYADDTIALARALGAGGARADDPRPGRAATPQTGGARPTVVTGGPGVTVFPEYFEQADCFDAVLPGAAETTLGAWLDAGGGSWGSAAPGGYPAVGRPAPAAGVDGDAPEPLWTYNRGRITTVLSRGCPRRCRFCSQFLTQGRTLRTASMASVEAMVAAWPEDVAEVNIEDDNLLLAPDFFFGALETIRARYPGVQFLAENGIDYTLIDGRTLDRLFDAGFRDFTLSLGSVSPEVLTRQERPSNLARWEALVTEIHARGGTSTNFFICGLENDTPDRTAATLVYLSRFPTVPRISLFYPVPGLPGFEDRSRFAAQPACLAAGSSAWPWTGSLTTAQMVTAFRLSRLIGLGYGGASRDGTGAGSRFKASAGASLTPTAATAETRALWERCLETGMLWTHVRDHGRTRMVPVPNQDEALAGAVLRGLRGEVFLSPATDAGAARAQARTAGSR